MCVKAGAVPVGEEVEEGKGGGMLLGGSVCSSFFVLRFLSFIAHWWNPRRGLRGGSYQNIY